MTSPWLTMDEACAYLRIHNNTLRRFVKLRRIVPGKVGRDYRFSVEMLDKFVLRGKS